MNDGYFDRQQKDGATSPSGLYEYLNVHWEEEPFRPVAEKIEDRVHMLMKSERLEYIRIGFLHLVAMVHVRYRGAERVLRRTLFQMNAIGGSDEEVTILMMLEDALKAIAAHWQNPSDSRLKDEADSAFWKIARTDTQGITGYWPPREAPPTN